jgi:hypothetical protein
MAANIVFNDRPHADFHMDGAEENEGKESRTNPELLMEATTKSRSLPNG